MSGYWLGKLRSIVGSLSTLPPFPTEYWAHAPFYAVSKPTYREILPWAYGAHTHFAQYLIRLHGVNFRHS